MDDDESDAGDDDVINAAFVAGEDEAIGKVAEFCQKIAGNHEIEGDVKLVLQEMGRQTNGAIIKTWIFSQGDNPEEMAEVVVNAAAQDGSGAGMVGVASYVVTLEGRRGRVTFKIEYPPADEDDDSPREPATERGVLALTMRHLQGAMKQNVELVRIYAASTDRRMSELTERNRELERGAIDQVRAVAMLYDRRQERDLQMQRLERAEQRKDDALGMLTNNVAPVALAKLMGAPLPGSSPMEMLSSGFFRSLRPEQLEALARSGVLTQEQLFQIGETLKMLIEQEERQRQAADMRAADRDGRQGQQGAPDPNAEPGWDPGPQEQSSVYSPQSSARETQSQVQQRGYAPPGIPFTGR